MTRPALILALGALGAAACAHDLDLTLIKVEKLAVGGRVEITSPLSRFAKVEGTAASSNPAAVDMAVRRRIGAATAHHSQLELDSRNDLIRWSGQLSDPEIAALKSKRFDESTPAARTLVSTYRAGNLVDESSVGEPSGGALWLGSVIAGARHIFAGLDHILFVIGLAVVGGSWKSILKILTCFTLAHATTLTCAALGLVQGNPRIVEPLIAASIVAVAVDGISSRSGRKRFRESRLAVIAFGFGLIHGFGFAGGLSQVGLQGGQLAGNLVSFTIGIEAGQISILTPVLLTLASLEFLSRDWARRGALAGSLALGMIGSFWLMERAF